ncbi:MAG: glutamine synthetase, partial [Candidatus Cybelea sp.]
MNSTPKAQWRRPSGKRDVVKIAREEDVRFVRLVFADIFGVSKNVSIPVDRLDDALEGRITFDGGSIDGFVRGEELDMVLRPDPSSFAIYPWRAAPEGREGRLICDIAMPD